MIFETKSLKGGDLSPFMLVFIGKSSLCPLTRKKQAKRLTPCAETADQEGARAAGSNELRGNSAEAAAPHRREFQGPRWHAGARQVRSMASKFFGCLTECLPVTAG
jgi:hypothetical protein